MKKIKVSEATGPVLDWMVAKAARLNPFSFTEKDVGQQRALSKWVGINVSPAGHNVYCPSEDWSQGGPIIERECIGFEWMVSEWKAAQNYAGAPYKDAPSMRPIGQRHLCYGPTPLIAATRCFVTSRLGDVVDVPEELV